MKSPFELYQETELLKMDMHFRWAGGCLLAGFLLAFVVRCYLDNGGVL